MPNFVFVESSVWSKEDRERWRAYLSSCFPDGHNQIKRFSQTTAAIRGEKYNQRLTQADGVFFLLNASAKEKDIVEIWEQVQKMYQTGLSDDVPIFIVFTSIQSSDQLDKCITRNFTTLDGVKSDGSSISLYQLNRTSPPKPHQSKMPASPKTIWFHGVLGLNKTITECFPALTLNKAAITARKGRITIQQKKPASKLLTNRSQSPQTPSMEKNKKPRPTSDTIPDAVPPLVAKVPTPPVRNSVVPEPSPKPKKEEIIVTLTTTDNPSMVSAVPTRTPTPTSFVTSTVVTSANIAESPPPIIATLPTPFIFKKWNLWTAALCGLGSILLTCIVFYVLQSLALLQVMAFISGLIAGTVLVALPPLGVLLMGLVCVGLLVALVVFPLVNREIIAAKWRGEAVNTLEDTQHVVDRVMDKGIFDLNGNTNDASNFHQKGVFSGEGYTEQLHLEGREDDRCFNRHTVLGDGNCGYTAFGITREKAYELLTQHAVTNRNTGVGIFFGEEAEAEVAEELVLILKPAIEEALLTGKFIDYLETKDAVALGWRDQKPANLSARDSNELETSSSRQSGSQTHSSEEEDVVQDITPVKLNDFNQVKRDFDQYQAVSDEGGDRIDRDVSRLKAHAADSAVILAYLNYDIRDKHIDGGWAHPCVLQALAHIREINLFLYQKNDTDQLIPHAHYPQYPRDIPEGSDRQTVSLLFVNNNHFDYLDLPEERRVVNFLAV